MRLFIPISLLLSSLFVALFSDTAYSYVPLLMLGAMFLLNYLALLSHKQNKVTLSLQESGRKKVTITVQLTKPHRLTCFASYKIYYKHSLLEEMHVLEGRIVVKDNEHTVTLPVDVLYCGQLQIQSYEVVFHDWLHWHQIVHSGASTEVATIWPLLKEHATLAGGMQFQQIGTDGGASERYVPYVPGDSIKAIHWPLTAKTQQVIVAKPAFARAQQQTVALYFNDVQTPAQYDVLMSECYSALMHGGVDEVFVWQQQGWQAVNVSTQPNVQALFKGLLQLPIRALYAEQMPQATTILRYKGSDAR